MIKHFFSAACPTDYVKFKNDCYYFGQHSSHEESSSLCKQSGATLAEVDPKNNNWIFKQLQVQGATDHWIGSYYVSVK